MVGVIYINVVTIAKRPIWDITGNLLTVNMKIIFLDIDGVLNSAIGTGPYESDMETAKLILLKKLIVNSGADGVVISSDRRYSKVDMSHKEAVFDKYEIRIIGVTRRPNEEDLDDNRGKQIYDYLNNSPDLINRILILDDIDDGISELFHEDFVYINRFYGFNEDAYQQAINVLKS